MMAGPSGVEIQWAIGEFKIQGAVIVVIGNRSSREGGAANPFRQKLDLGWRDALVQHYFDDADTLQSTTAKSTSASIYEWKKSQICVIVENRREHLSIVNPGNSSLRRRKFRRCGTSDL
jgi:hypothetical protein